SDLFGCIGLNGQKFCILNKQYSQEQYEELVPRIIEHMKQSGEWGEMFPVRLSPFGYNDTLAGENYPLTQEEVEGRGWPWQKKQRGTYGKETLSIENIPATIKDTEVTICGQVLACEECKKNYRIVRQEFELYVLLGVPVPLRCPECRHQRRFNSRTPYKLWHRQCMCEKDEHDHTGRCPAEFETAYAPERSETVFCESCYQKEIV
ncbi:MAG: hypothetical protein Q8P56_04205, partial [Candidatus Uhrbacteria bacterium]|nr:hypothetical protein [Candidatus Uhrbacteria bacterium]